MTKQPSRPSFRIIAGLALALCSTNAVGAGEAELAALILQAEAERKPIPMLSRIAPDLDLAGAYRVQRAYVERRLRSDAIGGFKAGVTGRLGRLWLGLSEPLAGVLFTSGRAARPAVIDLSNYRRLIVETEIALIVGRRIAGPVADVAALRGAVRAVAPAIEMPEGGFVSPRLVRAVDIVAANVSAARFIVGEERPLADLDLGAVVASLFRDGDELSRGQGSDAMGDPWRSALWLVNAAVAGGWTVEPGNVLMTGILGERVPAEPGRYRADFGALGSIAFELR